MQRATLLSLTTLAATLITATACHATDRPQIVVPAVNFLAASDGVTKTGSYVSIPSGDHWCSYNVDVPVAGRYRVEVSAKADSDAAAKLYVEDYVDNKDGRNYNITAAMVAPPGADFATVGKDGSPLNTGTHRMKLHANGGSASIESIKFTLIKPHELTPYRLKQNVIGENWKLVWSDEFENDGHPTRRRGPTTSATGAGVTKNRNITRKTASKTLDVKTADLSSKRAKIARTAAGPQHG